MAAKLKPLFCNNAYWSHNNLYQRPMRTNQGSTNIRQVHAMYYFPCTFGICMTFNNTRIITDATVTKYKSFRTKLEVRCVVVDNNLCDK